MVTSKRSKYKNIIGAPVRVLIKVRDLYVKGLMDCATRVDYSIVGGPTAQVLTPLPKSFYVYSSVDDHHVQSTSSSRLALRTSPGSEVEESGTASKIRRGNDLQSKYVMAMRSYSVGVGVMGRIDEDKCCSFEDDMGDFLYTRCRSYPAKRKVAYC